MNPQPPLYPCQGVIKGRLGGEQALRRDHDGRVPRPPVGSRLGLVGNAFYAGGRGLTWLGKPTGRKPTPSVKAMRFTL